MEGNPDGDDSQEYTINDLVSILSTMSNERKSDMRQVNANMRLLEEKVK